MKRVRHERQADPVHIANKIDEGADQRPGKPGACGVATGHHEDHADGVAAALQGSGNIPQAEGQRVTVMWQ